MEWFECKLSDHDITVIFSISLFIPINVWLWIRTFGILKKVYIRNPIINIRYNGIVAIIRSNTLFVKGWMIDLIEWWISNKIANYELNYFIWEPASQKKAPYYNVDTRCSNYCIISLSNHLSDQISYVDALERNICVTVQWALYCIFSRRVFNLLQHRYVTSSMTSAPLDA